MEGNGIKKQENGMKNKSDLFDLIQSMSKSEKRYFSLAAKKGGRRSLRYLELFQAINEMESYTEEALQKAYGSSLPTDKHYLYEALLQSLRDYNSSKSQAARIKEMILDADYLYKRGLYRQSEARLGQAKRLAIELDDQLALLEISREQLNYVWTTKPDGYGERIEALLSDKDAYIHSINEELKYLSLAYKIQMAGNSKLSDIVPPELFDEAAEQGPATAHAQRRLLQSGALYFDLLGDLDKANTYYAKMVDWWDRYPNIKAEEYNRYLADLFNLLHAAYSQKQYAQFEQLLQRIRQEAPGSYHDQQLIFKQLTNYQLLYHINLGVVEGHEQLLQRMEAGISTYKLNPVSQLIMAFNATVLLLVLEENERCKIWADKVLHTFNRKVDSEPIRLATLLINLLASFKEEEVDRFDSALRALRRALKQRKPDTPAAFFQQCVQQLRRISSLPTRNRQEQLQVFAAQIRSLVAEGAEKIPLGMDELALNWIEAQERSVPLSVVLREKAKASV